MLAPESSIHVGGACVVKPPMFPIVFPQIRVSAVL
jgi:hypothetical protein